MIADSRLFLDARPRRNMRLRTMKLVTALAAASAVLALAACGPSTPPPTPPPSADLTVSYSDNRGLFYMSSGQTLLVKLSNASSGDSAVLSTAGRYTDATLFKAAATGRRTVTAEISTSCPTECNSQARFQIVVVVVSDSDLMQGVSISEQDQPWVVHLRSGQRFVVTLLNPPSGPAWIRLTSTNPAIVVSEQPPVVSASAIQGRFQAVGPGRAAVEATGAGCPLVNACPSPGYFRFTSLVFV